LETLGNGKITNLSTTTNTPALPDKGTRGYLLGVSQKTKKTGKKFNRKNRTVKKN